MYHKKSLYAYSGTTFLELLALALIVLKFLGVIDWPWVWVLSPLWISFLAAMLAMAIAAIYIFVFKEY